MTINGNHSAGELQDLLKAKDYSIKQLQAARAAFHWTDVHAAADWDADMVAFLKRYNPAAAKGRAAIILAYSTGPLGAMAFSVEGEYQDVLHALTVITGQYQKGDFQDLDVRLAAASGAEPDYSKMPQPTAVDADLAGYKGADAGAKALDKVTPPPAAIGLGLIVGVMVAGVVASVMLPSLIPGRRR